MHIATVINKALGLYAVEMLREEPLKPAGTDQLPRNMEARVDNMYFYRLDLRSYHLQYTGRTGVSVNPIRERDLSLWVLSYQDSR